MVLLLYYTKYYLLCYCVWQVSDTLTSVKKVNKTDAVTLLSTFGVGTMHCVTLPCGFLWLGIVTS